MTANGRRGVLLIADDLQMGGVSRVVLDLASALVAAGVPVGIAAHPEGELWDRIPAGVDVHPFAGGSRVSVVRNLALLRRLAVSGRYEIFHAHQRGVAILAGAVVTGTAVKVVEHVHNTFAATPLARLLSFRSELLIACGTRIEKMLVDDFGRAPSRVRLVLNGVADSGASASPAGARPFHLIGVGRLAEQKDPERFVRVIAELAARMPAGSVRATWYGDGPLRSRVLELARELGVERILSFPGATMNMAELYPAADLLLLTSRWEGLPLVALEAMSAGCAVALPDIGSCSDVFGDEPVGSLYPPTTSDDELGALLATAISSGLAALWSANARERYEAQFTLERMTVDALRVYDEALGRIRVEVHA